MMRQYDEIRTKLPEKTLLLFRLGDFYEMFNDDAKIGSQLLDITLTHRNKIPMAGMPFHAADTYINKILSFGYKVAICDQLESPQPGKLVTRGLTRILTPGTVISETQIEAAHNRYISGFTIDNGLFCAAWLEVSTGEFQICSSKNLQEIIPALTSINPAEIIIPEYEREKFANLDSRDKESISCILRNSVVSEVFHFWFDRAEGAQYIRETLGVLTLNGYGVSDSDPSLGVASALLRYTSRNLCSKIANLQGIKKYAAQKTLLLDTATIKNLEIFYSTSGTRRGSLLAAINRTKTAAGARLLEKFLIEPTLVVDEIARRQKIVGAFVSDRELRKNVSDIIKSTCDLSRIITRLHNKMRNPRELGAIRNTLQVIPTLRNILGENSCHELRDLSQKINNFSDLSDLLNISLGDNLPTSTQDGGFVRHGYNQELDRIRSLSSDCQTWLTEIELAEQKRTRIKNLRIKYNGAFGYFIEITKANIHLVPPDYIRRQTTVNSERYITHELRQKEREILSASQESITLENKIFDDVLSSVLGKSHELQTLAQVISQIDVFQGFGELADDQHYCCPTVSLDDSIEIVDGRHPVVEQTLKESLCSTITHEFVANSTKIDCIGTQIALITGPNMAGKSTYIRQVALITLMAHIGSWVPAHSCKIGIVDRIFSRIGSGDDISSGNSTFMVEMTETANILNNATERSLVILDEIGRGTSTYDGLSIAWAVIEYLHGSGNSGPKTLFATHYHEITQLEKSLNRLKNFQVVVKEIDDKIIFLRQVIEGAADRSYGIQVAKLAGLPPSVVDRAKQVLTELESEGTILQSTLEKSKKRITNLKKYVAAAQIELL